MRTITLAIIAIALGLAGLTLTTAAADDAGAPSVEAAGSAAAAPAADEPALPDPLEQPGESLSLLGKLYKGGQIAALSILAAFFALTIASRKIKWLQEGYRKVAVSAVLGAAALLAAPAASGTTPNLSMIVGALIAAVTLAINPAKKQEPAA